MYSGRFAGRLTAGPCSIQSMFGKRAHKLHYLLKQLDEHQMICRQVLYADGSSVTALLSCYLNNFIYILYLLVSFISSFLEAVVVRVSRKGSAQPTQMSGQVLHLRSFFVPHVPRLLGQLEELCDHLASKPPHFAATSIELNPFLVCCAFGASS